jgi:hypothetical protein
MKTEYYVKLKDGNIQNLFRIIISPQLEKRLYRLTEKGTFALLISTNNCLEGVVEVSPIVFEFLKTLFLKGDRKLWYMRKPATEKHFEDNHFVDLLQYVIQSNLFRGGEYDINPQTLTYKMRKGLVDKTLPTKSRTKYTLFHGDKEVITGYSIRSSQEMAELLIDAITTNKSIKVRGKDGDVIAFYNKVVVGEFSFSIYPID